MGQVWRESQWLGVWRVKGSGGARSGVGFVGLATEAWGLGGGWGSVQAVGLEAARLLGLGPPVEAVRPFLAPLGGEETSWPCLLLSRSMRLGSGSSTASSSASSNSSSSSMSSIFSSLSLLRNLGTKEGLTTLTHSMEPSDELELKLRLELELLELDTKEGELGLEVLFEKRISSSPWDMSFNLVGILSWKQGRAKEVVGLVSISLFGLMSSRGVATDRWSLEFPMGFSMVEGSCFHCGQLWANKQWVGFLLVAADKWAWLISMGSSMG